MGNISTFNEPWCLPFSVFADRKVNPHILCTLSVAAKIGNKIIAVISFYKCGGVAIIEIGLL